MCTYTQTPQAYNQIFEVSFHWGNKVHQLHKCMMHLNMYVNIHTFNDEMSKKGIFCFKRLSSVTNLSLKEPSNKYNYVDAQSANFIDFTT